MSPLNSAIYFFIQNWVSIIFAIFLASIFYLLSARGIKKVITSRQEERLKIAKESIVDVLEHQIINNSDINTDKIIHLLNATSRERGVNLTNEYTSLDLLEDLELRFAKSKHLKNDQREEYIGKIEILLKNIEDDISIIIPSYGKVLTDLEESIEIGNREAIKRHLNFLRTKLTLEKEKRKETESIAYTLAALITSTLLAFLGLTMHSSSMVEISLMVFSMIFLIMGVIIYSGIVRKVPEKRLN